jgi:hypothetical protein
LRAHILIAADVIAAAKGGDSAKLADAQARWVKNAHRIAAVLHSVNRRFWKLGTMKAEMHRRLEQNANRRRKKQRPDVTN